MEKYTWPKTIDLLGHKYRIIYAHPPTKRWKDAEGLVRIHKQVIYIDPVLQGSARAATLLHEILHVIDYHVFGNRLFGSAQDPEERIDVFSAALFQIMRANGFLLGQSRKGHN